MEDWKMKVCGIFFSWVSVVMLKLCFQLLSQGGQDWLVSEAGPVGWPHKKSQPQVTPQVQIENRPNSNCKTINVTENNRGRM